VDLSVIGMTGLEKDRTLVIFLIGRFDALRIFKAVEAAVPYGGTVERKALYGQTVLVVSKGGRPDSATVVIDSRCVIFGPPGAVESTLESWASGRRPLASNTVLMDLVKDVAPSSGFWLALDSSVAARVRKQPETPPRFPITMTMALRRSGLEVVAEMSDEAA